MWNIVMGIARASTFASAASSAVVSINRPPANPQTHANDAAKQKATRRTRTSASAGETLDDEEPEAFVSRGVEQLRETAEAQLVKRATLQRPTPTMLQRKKDSQDSKVRLSL
jgi:hypothetical protein